VTSEQIKAISEKFATSAVKGEIKGEAGAIHVGQLYLALLEIAYQLAVSNERQSQLNRLD